MTDHVVDAHGLREHIQSLLDPSKQLFMTNLPVFEEGHWRAWVSAPEGADLSKLAVQLAEVEQKISDTFGLSLILRLTSELIENSSPARS